MSVPLSKFAELKRVVKTACDWYASHSDWAEFDDPTLVFLTLDGEIVSARGGVLYLLEQSQGRWQVARIDKDTDAATVDCDALKEAWRLRGEQVVEVCGNQIITVEMREQAELERQREEEAWALRKVQQDASRI